MRKTTFLLPLLLFAIALPLLAQEPNRAALVIRMGDDAVKTACVSFTEESISGYDLLQRAGLPITIEASGMGTAVCSINNIGCPSTDCFCACTGSDCTYWSYWHQSDRGWLYADGGASIATITSGDMDGWSWGAGSVTDAVPPPALTFADICDAPTDTPTNTPSPITRQAAPYAVFLLMLGGLFAGQHILSKKQSSDAPRN